MLPKSYILLSLLALSAALAFAASTPAERVITPTDQMAAQFGDVVSVKSRLEKVATVIDSQGCYWHVVEGKPGDVTLIRATAGSGRPICSR